MAMAASDGMLGLCLDDLHAHLLKALLQGLALSLSSQLVLCVGEWSATLARM